jgi:hypothetical protein
MLNHNHYEAHLAKDADVHMCGMKMKPLHTNKKQKGE